MILRIFRSLKRRTILFLVNKVFSGTNPHLFNLKRILLNSIGYNIGQGTKIVGPIYCTGKLTTGTQCWIGTNFVIRGNGTVILGNNIDVGPDVTILTGSHQIGTHQRRAGKGVNCTIKVGNGCWIGGRSVLLNSVTIGDGSVVAAGAVVVSDVPQDIIAGGVPAKLIRGLNNE